MIRRPLDPQFNAAVEAEIKTTTIREKPWPVGVPIMLYNWKGRPYGKGSTQVDVRAVIVRETTPIRLYQTRHGAMGYFYPGDPGNPGTRALWETEGFPSKEAMYDWFRPHVKPTTTIEKHLMRFELFTPNQTVKP
jgi:hypothetical protein